MLVNNVSKPAWLSPKSWKKETKWVGFLKLRQIFTFIQNLDGYDKKVAKKNLNEAGFQNLIKLFSKPWWLWPEKKEQISLKINILQITWSNDLN